jgi:acyl-CoA thioesterase I
MRRLAVLLVLLFASHASVAAPPDAEGCGIAPALVTPTKPLDALKAAIAARRDVGILAVGSGATAGGGSIQAGNAYPIRMLEVLKAALPHSDVTVTVRGGRGLTAVEMLPLVESELKQISPVVVLWQTGTVEAIRAMRADRMRNALRTGLGAIRAAGADLVVIDPQFTRALRANTDREPYEAELQQVGGLPGANLFHRFELTRGWALEGRIDPERAPKETRERVLDRLNACAGEALAHYLLNGVGVAVP